MYQAEVSSNIANKITGLAHRKSYVVIICANSVEKFTKREILSS